MKRASGVLLPVASLPSKYGIGCFSKEAYDFIDKLRKAGQSYWQILPLSPTSYGDSPYQSFSSFAGNPYFIDLEALIEEGVLTKAECKACDFGKDPQQIDYGKLYENRFALLRLAYERSNISANGEFSRFAWENGYWLEDYALFMAVKQRFDGAPWSEWADDIKKRWEPALDYYRRECYFDIEFYKYLQFQFHVQWRKLKEYANENGIQIIGDIPIYVAFDSADAWANPQMFQFDYEFNPVAVAGCPPDAFSETGQLWGNPLYRWDYHRQTGYWWWCQRLSHCFQLYDVVRIDHFRGFDEYYSIPFEDETAENGHWEKGPGMELFRALRNKLGDKEIIAEDLGLQTASVAQLLRDSGYPGMKVLEFAFDPDEDTDYLPHCYEKNCVVYTGTHDNETLVQWYKALDKESKAFAQEYMDNADTPEAKRYWDFIRLAMMSTANTCIIPLQDYLGLDGTARINKPSTLGINWMWRMDEKMFSKEMIDKIYRLTRISGRLCDEAREAEAEKKLARKLKKQKALGKNTDSLTGTLKGNDSPEQEGTKH
ncbi:MAG: 4-alpha-glucanotransferase [Blautia sp.]|nr:4-alpha-glucanotransferase [Lachnoclostridium sp.]MCM1212126.1 4-alpha-glucanotransferase [Blautia sp.]